MKRAIGARHTECMHHIGCKNEAALVNMVEFHLEKLHVYIFWSFAPKWGGDGGSRNLGWILPLFMKKGKILSPFSSECKKIWIFCQDSKENFPKKRNFPNIFKCIIYWTILWFLPDILKWLIYQAIRTLNKFTKPNNPKNPNTTHWALTRYLLARETLPNRHFRGGQVNL